MTSSSSPASTTPFPGRSGDNDARRAPLSAGLESFQSKRQREGFVFATAHVLDPDDPRHGTTNGYGNLGCRCDRCREANAVAHRAYMAARPEQIDKARRRDEALRRAAGMRPMAEIRAERNRRAEQLAFQSLVRKAMLQVVRRTEHERVRKAVRGYTLDHVAAICGVARSTVHHADLYGRNVSIETMRHIADTMESYSRREAS